MRGEGDDIYLGPDLEMLIVDCEAASIAICPDQPQPVLKIIAQHQLQR
jgi:hypothetical protein